MKKINHNQGFTLIEVLVSSSIFVIVMSTIMIIFSVNSSLRNKVAAIRETSINARYAIEAIAREVRLANSFYISNSGNNLEIVNFIDGQPITRTYYFVPIEKVIKVNIAGNINNLTNPSLVSINTFGSDGIFSGVDSKNTITSNFQPYLDIKFKVESNLGTKKIDKFIQTIGTRITTRNYPGFSQSIPIEQQN